MDVLKFRRSTLILLGVRMVLEGLGGIGEGFGRQCFVGLSGLAMQGPKQNNGLGAPKQKKVS